MFPGKGHGRPLLLKDFLMPRLRKTLLHYELVQGVLNTAIVLVASKGIVAVSDCGLLKQHGGSLELTSGWAKSLLTSMGYIRRKGSTSTKLLAVEF